MLSLSFTQIDFFSASPYILIMALAGILTNKSRLKFGAFAEFRLFVLLPGILYWMGHSFTGFIIYFIGCIVLLIIAKKSWIHLFNTIAPLSLFIILVYVISINSSSLLISQRYTAFLNPYKDPLNTGYMTVQSIEAIKSAGMYGHGFGVQLRNLPSIHLVIAKNRYGFFLFGV